MLTVVLTAVALGLSNFAAAIAIGLGGVDTELRLRVAITFGLFEAAMPIAGLALGHQLTQTVASPSRYLGGGLLMATGSYTAWQASRSAHPSTGHATRLRILIPSAAALSIDNLIVGFALGTQHVGLATAAITIAVISVVLSLLGLELGNRLGRLVEARSGELAGIVLIAVGAAITLGLL